MIKKVLILFSILSGCNLIQAADTFDAKTRQELIWHLTKEISDPRYNQAKFMEIESYLRAYNRPNSFHNGIMEYISDYIDRYLILLPKSHADILFNECLNKIFQINPQRLKLINQLFY